MSSPAARIRLQPHFVRLCMVLAISAAAAATSVYFWSLPHPLPSDFSQIWAGSRELVHGGSPYAAVGPDKSFAYGWRTPYPLPAFLIGVPFTVLPLRVADALFAAVGAGALAWSLTRTRWNDPRLLAFASFGYLHAAQLSQWSPLLTAAALTPLLGFALAAKPTIGAALWIAYPSVRSALAVTSMFVLSFLVRPNWVFEWWPTLSDLTHVTAPVTLTGGPLILLGLLKWRQPEARLLVGLACAPQSTFLYEAIPLFLIVRRAEEGAILCSAMLLTQIIWNLGPTHDFSNAALGLGQLMVWFVYLPCLVMILRRPDRRLELPSSAERAPRPRAGVVIIEQSQAHGLGASASDTRSDESGSSRDTADTTATPSDSPSS